MANRLLQDLGGVIQNDGTLSVASPGIPSWAKASVTGILKTSYNAQWTIGIGTTASKIIHILGFGHGPKMGVGPFTLAPNESLVIQIEGGNAGDQMQATMYGIQNVDPKTLTMDTPGTSVPPPTVLSTIVFRRSAWDDGGQKAQMTFAPFPAGTRLSILAWSADLINKFDTNGMWNWVQFLDSKAHVYWQRALAVESFATSTAGNFLGKDHITSNPGIQDIYDGYSDGPGGISNGQGNFTFAFETNNLNTRQSLIAYYSTSDGLPH